MDQKVANILFIFLGTFVLAVHAGMFFFSKNLFNLMMSVYIIAYIIAMLVFTYKKKECSGSTERDTILYVSMFLLGLELLVLLLSLYLLMKPAAPYSTF